MTIKEKFLALVSGDSNTIDRTKKRIANREQLKVSRTLAIAILELQRQTEGSLEIESQLPKPLSYYTSGKNILTKEEIAILSTLIK